MKATGIVFTNWLIGVTTASDGGWTTTNEHGQQTRIHFGVASVEGQKGFIIYLYKWVFVTCER